MTAPGAAAEHLRSLDELPRGARLCLYGAGEGGVRFLAVLRAERPDLAVTRFVDDGRRGARAGVPVAAADDPGALTEGIDLVLVTSSWWRAIAGRLAGRGLAGFRVVDPALYFPEQVFSPAEREAVAPLAARAEALLATERDRALYRAVLANRGLGGGSAAADPYALHAEAFPGRAEYLDFIVWERVRRAIDGGALDGRTALDFLGRMPPGGEVWAFEPDESVLLGGPHAERLRREPGVHLRPLALWSRSGPVDFCADCDDPSGSKVLPEGASRPGARRVPAVSVDDFVRDEGIERLDFLKLDVEGGEPEVLAGAERTLARCRPQLAVCIYHRKEQLYSIPLRLAEMLPAYVHHLGHYSPSFWDTVWYAIPGELAGRGRRPS